MKFRTTILKAAGKNATGIHVPDRVVEALGAGKRPKVAVTLNGHTYRNTIAVMDGRFMVGVSSDVRAAAGVKGGDELEVEIVLDTAPRGRGRRARSRRRRRHSVGLPRRSPRRAPPGARGSPPRRTAAPAGRSGPGCGRPGRGPLRPSGPAGRPG